jgi:hypothetical protein
MQKRKKASVKTGIALAAAVLSVTGNCPSQGATAESQYLVVLRVGDGVSALGASAAPISLVEYDVTYTGGAPISISERQIINAPTSNTGSTHAISQTGISSLEGGLSCSADGRYMTFVGYNSSPGGTTNQIAATEGGVVGLLNLTTGNIDTSTVFSRTSNTNAWRGSYTPDGNDIWIATSVNGLRYTSAGSSAATTAIETTPSNTRRVAAVTKSDGSVQLYISSASGTFAGISKVGSPPPPTTGPQTVTLLSGMPTFTTGESPLDFWFADDNTIYIADDIATTVGGLGLQKWTSSNGGATWTVAWNHAMTSTGGHLGIRSLAGYRDGGGNDILFASTTGTGANYLIGLEVPAGDTNGSGVVENMLVDGATAFGGTPGDWNLRGLAIAPATVPEPVSLTILAGVGALLLRRSKHSARFQ